MDKHKHARNLMDKLQRLDELGRLDEVVAIHPTQEHYCIKLPRCALADSSVHREMRECGECVDDSAPRTSSTTSTCGSRPIEVTPA